MANRSKKAMKADKKNKAYGPGKRESENGNTYYESRPNRSDKSRSARLERGGILSRILGKKK